MVRWFRETEGTRIDRTLLQQHLSEIDYSFMENQSSEKELTFRNNAYHLTVRPKILRTHYQLHIDTRLFEHHDGVINKNKNVESEAERIQRYLDKFNLDPKSASQ